MLSAQRASLSVKRITTGRFLTTTTLPDLRASVGGVDPNTRYGGRSTCVMIPGDGVGTEICNVVRNIFEAARVPVDWVDVQLQGEKADEAQVKVAIEALKRHKVGLKAIIHTPVGRGIRESLNVRIRKELDIYASVALVKSIRGHKSRHQNVDFAIIRENTEGEYSGLEHQAIPGTVVENLKVVTRAKSERIARFAFDFAIKNQRKRVTCVHKANIMYLKKLSDGLFLNTVRAVGATYANTGIAYDDMIVDNTAMQLVARPQQFDVMVLPNLYGSIVSNIGAGLVGSPGVVSGGNVGREHALFEPGCRHVGRDIEGRNVANPTAIIYSACLMLRHLGYDYHASRIARAVELVYEETPHRTADLGGTTTTTGFRDAVLQKMEVTYRN